MRKRLLLRPTLWALVILTATAAWQLRPLDRTTLYPVPFANGKYGYVNTDGRAVIAAEWNAASSFGADGYAVVNASDKHAFIDRAGNLAEPLGEGFEHEPFTRYILHDTISWKNIDCELTFTQQFVVRDDANFTPVRQATRKKWGLALNGKTVIEPMWDDIRPFGACDLAPVKVGERWGFVDRSGKLAIEPNWKDVGVFAKNGLALVKLGEQFFDHWPASSGKFSFKKLCPTGFIDRTGKLVIPLQWDNASDFDDGGLAIVRKNKKMGVIDSTGKLIVPTEWDRLYPFDPSGLARVQRGDYWGYIDRTGAIVIRLECESVSDFDDVESIHLEEFCIIDNFGHKRDPLEDRNELRPDRKGLAHVSRNGKHGCIDRTGSVAIPLEWDTVGTFDASRIARVKNNGKWGFINREGNIVNPLDWDEATVFDEQSMSLVAKNDKWGFIDRSGNIILPLEWDYAQSFDAEGLAIVTKGNKSGAFNRAGKNVIPLDWDEVFGFKNGVSKVKKGKHFGFINRTAEIVVPPEWDRVESFQNRAPIFMGDVARTDPYTPDLIEVTRDKKSGIIDWSGIIIIAPEWTHIDIRSDAEAKTAAFVVTRPIDPNAQAGWIKAGREWLFKLLAREEPRIQLCHLYDTQGRLIWSSDWLSEAFWIWAVALAASIVVLADGVALWRRKRQVAGTS